MKFVLLLIVALALVSKSFQEEAQGLACVSSDAIECGKCTKMMPTVDGNKGKIACTECSNGNKPGKAVEVKKDKKTDITSTCDGNIFNLVMIPMALLAIISLF